MRRAPALAWLTVAALLAGLGGTPPAADSMTISSRAASLPASAIALQPDLADPACNGGRGARLPAGPAANALVASATLADGSTLIALTNIDPGERSAALRSITPACALNGEFGDDGAATITIPAGLKPTKRTADSLGPEGLWINAIAPGTAAVRSWPASLGASGRRRGDGRREHGSDFWEPGLGRPAFSGRSDGDF